MVEEPGPSGDVHLDLVTPVVLEEVVDMEEGGDESEGCEDLVEGEEELVGFLANGEDGRQPEEDEDEGPNDT